MPRLWIYLAIIFTTAVGFILYLIIATEKENSIIMSLYNNIHGKQLLLEYFNLSNAIHLTWAHAVNNKLFLDEVLSDTTSMMLEADVIMDPVKKVPIMAHPPATSSDLELVEWLHLVSRTDKGVKLDFKEDSALVNSYQSIVNFLSNDQNVVRQGSDLNQPILIKRGHRPFILNADILQGPNSIPSAEPVNPDLFIDTCKKISAIIVSPGWVTDLIANGVGYSWENVHQMYALVKELHQEITFPIRASLAVISSDQLMWLLEQNVDKFSLTIWTSIHDEYGLKGLVFLRKFKKRIYFDLPTEQKKELLSLIG